MSNLDKLEIKALTKAAEAGDGCAIKDAISALFWEERFAALKRIEQQNKENRVADPKIVELSVHGYGNSGSRLPGGMDLHYGKGWIGHGPTIYVEEIHMGKGMHTSTCEKPMKY
jgi:hypothetical protein